MDDFLLDYHLAYLSSFLVFELLLVLLDFASSSAPLMFHFGFQPQPIACLHLQFTQPGLRSPRLSVILLGPCIKVTWSTTKKLNTCTDYCTTLLNLFIVVFSHWQHSTVVWLLKLTGTEDIMCLFTFNRNYELSVILTNVLVLPKPIKFGCWLDINFMVYMIYGLSSTLFHPNVVILGQRTVI